MGLTFGRKYSDAPPPTSGGGGKWIKSLKEGETKIRFLQEIKDWYVYYEHYNPAGSAFPCTGDKETCPGCTSSNERMKQASRKNAVNAVVGGYVDVYKLPVKLTNRLVARSERYGGTITDRDYLITRIGKDKDTEYDMEALSPRAFEGSFELADVEAMLAEQFAENFPDFNPGGTARPTQQTNGSISSGNGPTRTHEAGYDVPGMSGSAEPPPFEAGGGAETETSGTQEVEVTEDELRAMDRESLLILCHTEQIELPSTLTETGNVDEIVDFLLENA